MTMEEACYFITCHTELNPFDSKIVVTITDGNQNQLTENFLCQNGETDAVSQAYAWINRNYPEALPIPSRLPSLNEEIPGKIKAIKRDAFYLGIFSFLLMLAGFCLSPVAIIPGAAFAIVGMYFHSQLVSVMYGHSMGVRTRYKMVRRIWNSLWGNMTNQEID